MSDTVSTKRPAEDTELDGNNGETLFPPAKLRKRTQSATHGTHQTYSTKHTLASSDEDVLGHEQSAGLESRIDMLEDLLLQLRSEQGQVPNSNLTLRATPGFVSVIPDMPDWSSRARQTTTERTKTRTSVLLPQTGDDSHEMLEMTLRKLERTAHHEQLSLPHNDDDFLIRGLEGWLGHHSSRSDP